MMLSDYSLSYVPYHDSIDDLIGGLGCHARGMARAHDGPMTPLTVGRNRVLSLCVYFAMLLSVNVMFTFRYLPSLFVRC